MKAPKYYAFVCDTRPTQYSNYERFDIKWGEVDCYEATKKIGHGRYSEVYEALNPKRCIIKILKPISTTKIQREVKILQTLHTGPNIVQLYDTIKDPTGKVYCLVYEAIDNVAFRSLYPSLKDFDIRLYLCEVLKALDFSHSQGVMHRDIKPQNIIVEHTKKILKVIDWGLAEYYHYGKEYNVKVSTLPFKAPELLINDTHYDYSLDMWSLGCVFAEILFKQIPFFNGQDDEDQLMRIAKVLGTKDLIACIEKYKLDYKYEGEKYKKIPFSNFITTENREIVNVEALDLLEQMLTYDKEFRITPKDAMNHPYFIPIRKYLNNKESP